MIGGALNDEWSGPRGPENTSRYVGVRISRARDAQLGNPYARVAGWARWRLTRQLSCVSRVFTEGSWNIHYIKRLQSPRRSWRLTYITYVKSARVQNELFRALPPLNKILTAVPRDKYMPRDLRTRLYIN